MNIQMAQSTKSKMKQPNALLEMVVKDGEVLLTYRLPLFQAKRCLLIFMQKRDKVRLDFTHEELYAFYNKVCCVCGAL